MALQFILPKCGSPSHRQARWFTCESKVLRNYNDSASEPQFGGYPVTRDARSNHGCSRGSPSHQVSGQFTDDRGSNFRPGVFGYLHVNRGMEELACHRVSGKLLPLHRHFGRCTKRKAAEELLGASSKLDSIQVANLHSQKTGMKSEKGVCRVGALYNLYCSYEI